MKTATKQNSLSKKSKDIGAYLSLLAPRLPFIESYPVEIEVKLKTPVHGCRGILQTKEPNSHIQNNIMVAHG